MLTENKVKRKNLRKLKIILSGGGTGGHIFPAIAIANAIKKIRPDTEFLFVGAEGRMEMEKVPAAGFKIVGLWISGFQRRLTLSNLMFPFKVISSLMKAKKIMNEFKPDLAIGTGGYASGPMLRVASGKEIPTLIQEQNSFPGITNRILSSKVSKICVAYPNMEKYFPKNKIVVAGNPVRNDIIDLTGKSKQAYEFFSLDSRPKTILVIGGSLGARTINESIQPILDELVKNNIQLVWQTGKTYFPNVKNIAENYSSKGIKIVEFIQKMDMAYSVADIVVSRAGAISLSELAVAGKACILVPSPNVAEDHQTKNAMTLVNAGAAIMVKDVESRTKLYEAITNLISNKLEIEKLQINIKKLAFADAADRIASEALSLIKQPTTNN